MLAGPLVEVHSFLTQLSSGPRARHNRFLGEDGLVCWARTSPVSGAVHPALIRSAPNRAACRGKFNLTSNLQFVGRMASVSGDELARVEASGTFTLNSCQDPITVEDCMFALPITSKGALGDERVPANGDDAAPVQPVRL